MSSFLEEFIVSNLIYFPCSMMLLWIYYTVFDAKYTLKKMLYYVTAIFVTGSGGHFFAVYFNNSIPSVIIKTIITLLLVLLCSRYILNIKYLKVFTSFVILCVLLATSNFITIAIFSLNDINLKGIVDNFTYRCIAQIIINLIVFIIIAAFFIFKQHKNISFKLEQSKVSSRGFVVIVTMVFTNIVVSLALANATWDTLLTFKLVLVSLLYLALLFVFSIFNLINHERLHNYVLELELHVVNNNTLQHFMDDVKRIKHNYNNMIAVLNGYVKLKKWDSLEKYLNEANADAMAINSIHLLTMLKIENAELIGLLSSKIDLAREKNITLQIKSEVKVDYFTSELYSTCEILGCLIDNAIDASEKSIKRFVALNIEDDKESLVFRIENSFSEKPDVREIFRKDFSTKGDGRGIGLWFVKSRVDKSKNLILNTFLKDDIFIQELIVEKQKSLAV